LDFIKTYTIMHQKQMDNDLSRLLSSIQVDMIVTVKATDSMDTGLSSCHFVATVYTPGFSA
jgi:hypothetical protein